MLINVGGQADQSTEHLDRLALDLTEGSNDEKWLQDIIHRHPECLPIEQIERGISGPVRAICQEMPLGSKSLDHLLLSPRGDIVIVETKLWRNSEARREVVAQSLDYAVRIFGMGFQEFQAAAMRGRTAPYPKTKTLYARFVEPQTQGASPVPPEVPSEAAFNDAVARNLRLGRAIVLIVGDGIQEEAVRLLEGVSSHARFPFTLAMASLEAFRVRSTGQTLIVPTIQVRTETVIRHIVEITGPSSANVVEPKGIAARANLTEAEYYEVLEAKTPGGKAAVASFVGQLESMHVNADIIQSLNLRWQSPHDGVRVTLMQFYRDGQIWLEQAGKAPIGLGDIFVRELGELLGAEARPWSEGKTLSLYRNGKPLRLSDVLDKLPLAVPVVERFVRALDAHYAQIDAPA